MTDQLLPPGQDPEALENDSNADARPSGVLSAQLRRPRTWLSFALAATLLAVFFVTTDIDLGEVISAVKNADRTDLLLAIVIYYLSLVVRTYRWRWMLQLESDENRSPSAPALPYLLGIYTISWSINCLVPAKLGDGYRAYRLKQDDGIRYSIGFGTIVSERFFDLMVLVVLLGLSGLLAFHGRIPSQANEAIYLGFGLALVLMIALLVMWFARAHIISRVPERFRATYTSFQETLFSIVRRPWIPASLALVIWLGEGGRVYFVSRSVDAGISFQMAVFVALISALLTTLPFTPAGLGVVEIAIITALKLVDVPADTAGAVALLDRFITYWLVILFGLVAYIVMARRSAQRTVPALSEGNVSSLS